MRPAASNNKGKVKDIPFFTIILSLDLYPYPDQIREDFFLP
jgi:hypothetical protein